MQYARDNLDLDPGWHTCKECDRDGDFTPDADGLCPECAARKNMAERIWSHYAHAREKHQYFCDRLLPDYLLWDNIREQIAKNLAFSRRRVRAGIRDHNLMWNELADCEVWEATEAIANGDKAHAVEELYDTIAVLLRTIDVLEGRQRLGKPETTGEMK